MTEGNQQEQSEREPRRAVRVGLTFEDFRSFVTTYASNISMGGMFIRASNPLSPGTLCNLDVKLKDGFPLIRGLSEVAWIRERAEGPDRPPGMGIRFRDLEQKSRDLIYEIVERRMADGGGGLETPELEELLESAEKRREKSDEEIEAAPAAEEIEEPGSALPDLDLAQTDSAPELFEALPDLDDDFDDLPAMDAQPMQVESMPDLPDLPDLLEASPPVESLEESQVESPARDTAAPLNLDDLLPFQAEDAPAPPRNLPERGAASSADDEDERSVSPTRLAPALLVIAIGATLGVLWMSGTLPGWLGLVDDIGSIPTSPAVAPPTSPAPPVGSEPAPEPAAEEPEQSTSPATPPPSAAPVPAPAPPPPRAAAGADPFTVVQDIRSQAAGSVTRVTLVCNGSVEASRVSSARLDGGSPRVLLKVRGVRRAYNPNRIDVGSPQLQRIRLGYHPGDELHVVLDLASAGVRLAGTEARDNLLIITLEGG